MQLCKKIKVEVDAQGAKALEWMQGKCCGLYNWHVMRLREGEKWAGWREAKKTLAQSRAYDPEINGVYNKLLQDVFFRLDRAMQGFFRRVANGEKPGFPRVKPRHQFFTLRYPAMYLEVQGTTIILPTGGGGKWGPKRFPNVVGYLTETPPQTFGEVAVTRDARGNYYCSFVYEEPEQQTTQAGIVALDLGIRTLAVGYTDTGKVYHVGGFKGYRWYNKQLDKIRSKRDRCKKKSRRYIKLSKVYKRVFRTQAQQATRLSAQSVPSRRWQTG